MAAHRLEAAATGGAYCSTEKPSWTFSAWTSWSGWNRA